MARTAIKGWRHPYRAYAWLAGFPTLGAFIVGCGGRAIPAELPVEDRVRLLAEECLRRHPDTPSITLDRFLRERQDGGWILVDARSDREQRVSSLPGAVPLRGLENRLGDDRTTRIAVYCTIGCRSGTATNRLRRDGFDAYNLEGGVLAWALTGRDFLTPEGKPTKRVHVYGRRWNALPADYEAVW